MEWNELMYLIVIPTLIRLSSVNVHSNEPISILYSTWTFSGTHLSSQDLNFIYFGPFPLIGIIVAYISLAFLGHVGKRIN